MVVSRPGRVRWFNFLLMVLLLIGVVAMLVRLAWSKLAGPPPMSPGTDPATTDEVPDWPTEPAPAQGSHIF